MNTRPTSDETLERQLIPTLCPDRRERARAWNEWHQHCGETALLKFIRSHNTTSEPDEDILQDAMLTAYLAVEGGRYQPQEGVPFTAYVKGIARNKLREAYRRRSHLSLDDLPEGLLGTHSRQTEADVEQRERQHTLWHDLDTLSPDRRQVLEHVLTGNSTDEIAHRMQISADLVRQHKSRGIRQLRRQLRARVEQISGVTGEHMWAAKSVPGCPDELTSTLDT
jgi:RNA polymerase sigma factor (sigma-70 family)